MGEFINSALGIPISEIPRDDIESVTPITEQGLRAGNLNREALVTFFFPKKRDSLLTKSSNIRSHNMTARDSSWRDLPRDPVGTYAHVPTPLQVRNQAKGKAWPRHKKAY